MPSLTSIGVALAAFFVAALLLLHWGDAYGPNAQRNAKTVAEINAKNSVLEQQLEADATTYADEQASRAKAMQDFKKNLSKRGACPLSQPDVDALVKLIGG